MSFAVPLNANFGASPVRDNLLILAITVVFTGAFIWLSAVKQDPKPTDATPRLIDCDPDFYAGKRVRVKTEGCQRIIDNEWGYRKQTDQPHVVVLRFAGPTGQSLPEYVTGNCQGRLGGAVLVDGCR